MRQRLAAVAAALALAGALAGCDQGPPAGETPGAAAPEPSPVDVLAGPWEFSLSSRDDTCQMTLLSEPAVHGFALNRGEGCEAAFPLLGEAAGWAPLPEDQIRFLNALGQPLLDLTQEEAGYYAAAAPGTLGTFALVNQDARDVAAPGPAQLAGDWTLSADDDPLSPRCRVTLGAEIGANGRLPVQQPDTCPAWISALALDGWALEDGAIVLYAGAVPLTRLAMEDPATWRGQAPNGQTLVLSLYLPGE